MRRPGFWLLFFTLALARPLSAAGGEVSRLIVYDVRGADAAETVLILDQQGSTVKIWLKDYLGQRTGEVPAAEYSTGFETLRTIPQFALKPEYQGHGLRAHAARGTITLAWKNPAGKQIKTIRYYAPEHNLDDFRKAFDTVWGLSRYAILSLSSLESPKLEYREDAVYFLSGSGWLTSPELDSALDWLRARGLGARAARAVWAALDQHYPPDSDFAGADYRSYCVRKAMVRVGAPAAEYLQNQVDTFPAEKRSLAEQILREIQAPKP
jgi:hypothetical protein